MQRFPRSEPPQGIAEWRDEEGIEEHLEAAAQPVGQGEERRRQPAQQGIRRRPCQGTVPSATTPARARERPARPTSRSPRSCARRRSMSARPRSGSADTLGARQARGAREARSAPARGQRTRRVLLSGHARGPSPGSRAAILFAMRGTARPRFRRRSGSAPAAGSDRAHRREARRPDLTVETRAGATREVAARKAAVPILPAPGSLRISPDGRSVAWIEVAGPSQLVPVMTLSNATNRRARSPSSPRGVRSATARSLTSSASSPASPETASASVSPSRPGTRRLAPCPATRSSRSRRASFSSRPRAT